LEGKSKLLIKIKNKQVMYVHSYKRTVVGTRLTDNLRLLIAVTYAAESWLSGPISGCGGVIVTMATLTSR